jgi:hypothetical protein
MCFFARRVMLILQCLMTDNPLFTVILKACFLQISVGASAQSGSAAISSGQVSLETF